MRCPKCGMSQSDGIDICQGCGVVISKYANRLRQKIFAEQAQPRNEMQGQGGGSAHDPSADSFVDRLLYVKPDTAPVAFWARASLYALLLIFTGICLLSPMDNSVLPIRLVGFINGPIQLGGLVIFRMIGEFVSYMGSNLLLVIFPLAFAFSLMFKSEDTFGASASIWWLGLNLIYMAPRINRANSTLSSYYDWHYVLQTFGLLSLNHAIATAVYVLGIGLLIGSMVWGGYLILRQHANLGH